MNLVDRRLRWKCREFVIVVSIISKYLCKKDLKKKDIYQTNHNLIIIGYKYYFD